MGTSHLIRSIGAVMNLSFTLETAEVPKVDI